jgi:tellurite resistance protein
MLQAQIEILRAACCVAGLDGHVCEKELPLLLRLAERLGVGRVSLQAMVRRAESDPNFFHEQFELLQRDPDRALKVVLLVAMADGMVSLEERVVLAHMAKRLGIDDARFDKLLRAAEKQLAQEGSDAQQRPASPAQPERSADS